MSDTPQSKELKSEFYPPYAEFAKTLRAWFVASGIGGPVALVANKDIWQLIQPTGYGWHIGILFLLGGGLQIANALINKHVMWHLYFTEDNPSYPEEYKFIQNRHKETVLYKFAYWYCDQNWIDELSDLYTLIVFSWATFLAFRLIGVTSNISIRCDQEKSMWVWCISTSLAGIIFCARLFWSFRCAKMTPNISCEASQSVNGQSDNNVA